MVFTDENGASFAAAGRARWKIENENNNTLNTKGYHFEHNFGHGKQFLSSQLSTMILLALFGRLIHRKRMMTLCSDFKPINSR